MFLQAPPAMLPALFLKDGGGLWSTLDWQRPPPGAERDRLGNVRNAIWKRLPCNALERAREALQKGAEMPLFTPEEVRAMEQGVCN